MEEAFTLTWEDATSVVQSEEVICGIENVESMLPGETEEFTDVCEEVVVQETTEEDGVEIQSGTENIMYLTEDNVLVMGQTSENDFQLTDSQEQFMECQVAEEVVTEQWNDTCPEIIVGSEEHVGDDEQAADDIEIPLNTDQDQYAASRPYPCDFCSRRFRKKANLMNHMVAHQTDRPHGCNLCGTRYIRKTDLMTHLKIHAYIPETDGLDEEDGPLDDSDVEKVVKRQKPSFMKKRKNKNKMDVSDERMASSSQSYDYVDEDVRLMEAMENNRSDYSEYLPQENHPLTEPRFPISDPRKPFVCQHCGVGFAREKALASHARVHGGDSPFECQKCGEMFWDANLMREHVKNKHGGIEDDYEDEDDDYSDDDSKFGQFFCPTCGMSFHRQDNLKRHQRLHVKEEFSNENEFGHVCNVCGESFPEALDLLAHAEVHARGSEYRCMICGEVCADDEAVAAHVRSKHGTALTANMCKLCGRTCKDKSTLLRHSWEHSREKMFACSKCAKTFHNKARLKRHMLSHRNKVVSCDVCGEEFPDGRSLMNHRHSHSSVSGRQFPCRECGKTFGSRSSQQIHIRIHTGERPYGCRFCWKAFADGGTLRKHERIHTGEKPYACAVCPRAFNQRVVLREHIRSHHSGPDPNYSNSMTPYCCSVCSDMFATSQDLIVHLIHHCDMNTAMKRQPQVGPRKYKRRRKLKPHELELMSAPIEDEEDVENDHFSDSEEERKKKAVAKKSKKTPTKVLDESSYSDVYNSFTTAIESINTIVNNSKTTPKTKKKVKSEQSVPSRPKMIHTQKTRVPVESDSGKVRHKTKTLVTRTQPTELKSATGERIRPRTKNVSYHIYNSDKMQVATFPEDDIAVNNLLASDMNSISSNSDQNNGAVHFEQPQMEVGSEQTIETEPEAKPEPVNITKVSKPRAVRRTTNNSLKPGRHLIGPGDKVVRLVKGGGILVSKKKKKDEPEGIFPDNPEEFRQEVKQEDPSALHELAEISMQHAQSMFKCEMCSEVFSDRSQLLVHVPIHI